MAGPRTPNDKLVRLLFFVATLKENGARRVTAVIPYLAYARKERQTKPRDPVTTRYVAELLEAAGVDAVVAWRRIISQHFKTLSGGRRSISTQDACSPNARSALSAAALSSSLRRIRAA